MKVSKDIKQVEKELLILEKMDGIIESLVSHFSPIYFGRVQRSEIFDALFILLSEKHKLNRPGDLWNVEIEYADALKLVSNFDFDIIFKSIETPEDIIPANFRMEFKVKIKSKGLIWLIHKYDADPFPSNPHAHQMDNNIKLDLSNGKCYQVREYIYTMKKKDLLLLREAAAKVFKGTLPALSV